MDKSSLIKNQENKNQGSGFGGSGEVVERKDEDRRLKNERIMASKLWRGPIKENEKLMRCANACLGNAKFMKTA